MLEKKRGNNQVFELNTSFNHNISVFAEIHSIFSAFFPLHLFAMLVICVYGPAKHKFNSDCVFSLYFISIKLFLVKWWSTYSCTRFSFCAVLTRSYMFSRLFFLLRSATKYNQHIAIKLYRHEWRISTANNKKNAHLQFTQNVLFD